MSPILEEYMYIIFKYTDPHFQRKSFQESNFSSCRNHCTVQGLWQKTQSGYD